MMAPYPQQQPPQYYPPQPAQVMYDPYTGQMMRPPPPQSQPIVYQAPPQQISPIYGPMYQVPQILQQPPPQYQEFQDSGGPRSQSMRQLQSYQAPSLMPNLQPNYANTLVNQVPQPLPILPPLPIIGGKLVRPGDRFAASSAEPRETFFDKFGQEDNDKRMAALAQQDKARRLRDELQQQIEEKKRRQEQERLEKEKWELKYGGLEQAVNDVVKNQQIQNQMAHQSAPMSQQIYYPPSQPLQQSQPQVTFFPNQPNQQNNAVPNQFLNNSFSAPNAVSQQPQQQLGGDMQPPQTLQQPSHLLGHLSNPSPLPMIGGVGALPTLSSLNNNGSPNRHPIMQEEYKNELMVQIEEKRKKQEEEKKRKLEEDEAEERRIKREQEELQKKYQQEQNPGAAPSVPNDQNGQQPPPGQQQQQPGPDGGQPVPDGNNQPRKHQNVQNSFSDLRRRDDQRDRDGELRTSNNQSQYMDNYRNGPPPQQMRDDQYYQSPHDNRDQRDQRNYHNSSDDFGQYQIDDYQRRSPRFSERRHNDHHSYVPNRQNQEYYDNDRHRDHYYNSNNNQHYSPPPPNAQSRFQRQPSRKIEVNPPIDFNDHDYQVGPDSYPPHHNAQGGGNYINQAPDYNQNLPPPPLQFPQIPSQGPLIDWEPLKRQLQNQLSNFQKDMQKMQMQQKQVSKASQQAQLMMRNYQKEIEHLQHKKLQIFQEMKAEQETQMKIQILHLSNAIEQLTKKINRQEHTQSQSPRVNKNDIIAEVLSELKQALPLQQYPRSQSPPHQYSDFEEPLRYESQIPRIQAKHPNHHQVTSSIGGSVVNINHSEPQSQLPRAIAHQKVTPNHTRENSFPHPTTLSNQLAHQKPAHLEPQLPNTTVLMPTKPEIELHFLEDLKKNASRHSSLDPNQYKPSDLDEIKEDTYKEEDEELQNEKQQVLSSEAYESPTVHTAVLPKKIRKDSQPEQQSAIVPNKKTSPTERRSSLQMPQLSNKLVEQSQSPQQHSIVGGMKRKPSITQLVQNSYQDINQFDSPRNQDQEKQIHSQIPKPIQQRNQNILKPNEKKPPVAKKPGHRRNSDVLNLNNSMNQSQTLPQKTSPNKLVKTQSEGNLVKTLNASLKVAPKAIIAEAVDQKTRGAAVTRPLPHQQELQNPQPPSFLNMRPTTSQQHFGRGVSGQAAANQQQQMNP